VGDLLLLFVFLIGGIALPLVVAALRYASPENAKIEAKAERGKREAERRAVQEREEAQRAAKERQEAAQRAARAAEEAARLKGLRDTFRAWEYICKAHALTCTRCGELAYPIPITADRYACPACRHQFVGAPHAVPLPPPNPDA